MKRIITLFTALLLVCSLLLSLTACGSKGDSADAEVFTTGEAEYTESKTPVGSTSEDVLNYFNTVVNGLKTEKPQIAYRYEKNVPDDSIKITKAGQEDAEQTDASLEALNTAAPGVKELMLTDIKKIEGQLPMGADNTEYLFVKGEPWASQLTIADIDYAQMKEVGDKYYITIILKDVEKNGNADSLTKVFDLRDKEAMLASDEFKKTEMYLKLNDYDVAYSGCKITVVVDRYTDQVINLNYYKSADVTAHMTGKGTYESYGDISVLFKLEDKSNYDIVWESEHPVSPLDTTTAVSAE